jgi:DNA phosphorothioation-dependent restriction protein DptF
MSPLSSLLSQLKSSSRHVIVNGNIGELSDLQQYLHIVRPPEEWLRRIIETNSKLPGGKLILLCGNVGDGKSHLLSHLGQQKLLGSFELHNDATESFDPSKTNLETLTENVLQEFSDKRIENSARKLILAINLGVVANFLEVADKTGYCRLADYIGQSHLLEATPSRDVASQWFAHVDFTSDVPVKFTSTGPVVPVFEAILKRVFLSDVSNPFFAAYQNSLLSAPDSLECINYGFLLAPTNQRAFSQLLVQAIVKNKAVFSIRELLDFLAELIVQDDRALPRELSVCMERFLPFEIFEGNESALQSSFSKSDPTRIRNKDADEQMFQLAAVNRPQQRINILFNYDIPDWVSSRLPNEIEDLPPLKTLCKFQRRLEYFRSGGERQKDDLEYAKFLETLVSVDEFLGDRRKHAGLQKFIDMLIRACECWHGDSHTSNHIVIKPPNQHSDYRLLREFSIDVVASALDCVTLLTNEFSILLRVNKSENHRLHVDLELFRMLFKVSHGYLPNRYDQQSCVALSAFVASLIRVGIASCKILIDRINSGSAIDYEATQSGFGVTFNRVQRL